MDLLPNAYAINSPLTNWTSSINDSEDSVYSKELFQGYSSGLLTFATATCIVFILVGVPGNLITIIALARCKKVRNATAVFIINLSLSDLLFCCFNLPLAASTFWNRKWTHGDLLCHFFPLLRYGLLAVSLFTVLAITINRYIMIGHPRIYPRLYRRKYLGVMVAATWLGAFCSLIPTWRGVWGKFGLDAQIGSCSILPDKNNHSPKEFLFIMAFVIPCISIIVCYARIFYIVRKTALRTQQDRPIVPSTSTRTIPQCVQQQQQPNNQPKSINNQPNGCDSNKNPEKYLTQQKNLRKSFLFSQMKRRPEIDEHSEDSSITSNPNHIMYDAKGLKFIDSSIDSDFPPSLSALRTNNNNNNNANKEQKLLSNSDRNLSTISIAKTVEFCEDIECNNRDVDGEDDDYDSEEYDTCNENHLIGVRNESYERELKIMTNITNNNNHNVRYNKRRNDLQEADSAVEESTSSSENNQIYHITSENNCNQMLNVQVEPSSSSGIDIPFERESPPRRIKKSLTASLRRIRRTKDKEGTVRKHSTMNTSGASILYPGRMTAKDRRLLKMILVIFISFLICYLPITTTKIIRSVHEVHIVNIMGYLLIYLTTCINPIIYVVMSSEYRQAYWNLLMCRTTNRIPHDVVQRGSQRT